jgi:hypothetical protein
MISNSLSFVKYGDWKPVDAPVLPALPKAKKGRNGFPSRPWFCQPAGF